MVRNVRQSPVRKNRRWVAAAAAVMLAALAFAEQSAAQGRGVHYQHPAAPPPGAIGSWQLRRGGPLPGHYQPVEIKAPSGAMISLAVDGQFEPPTPSPLTAGMLIGSVYRMRVTNIPLHEGDEVFPTLEVIDRTYTPVHYVWRFPIPIELTQVDLDLALSGKFVTRVIYLEDPQRPVLASDAGQQFWFEARPGENPLQVADGLGRPVAILRMGGRLPADPQQPDAAFMFGSPQFLKVVRPVAGIPLEAPRP